MRLRNASLRPTKKIPIKDIKLTTVTDARIAIRSAMDFSFLSGTFFLRHYQGRWVPSEAGGAMYTGLPWLRAWAVFFLALCTSLHTVPLETPILCPASSWDSPSKSTSRKASSSAISKNIGSKFLGGLGVKLFVGGVIPNIKGFGNLPLVPYLCLRLHTVLLPLSVWSQRLLNMLRDYRFLLEPTVELVLQPSWQYFSVR